MNIILLILDSLRKDCIEYLDQPFWGKVHTPNLNRFAEESFILDNCYPESLFTLPARRAIYTGQRVYPFEDYKIYKGDFASAPGWGPIREERTTVSEMLQAENYTTCLISDITHQFKPSKNFHRGFNEWIFVRGYETDSYRSGPTPSKKEIDYWLPKKLQSERYVSFLKQCLMNFQDIKKEEDYSVAKVIKESIRWLKQNRDKENKFLLIESWSPHEPWFVPDKYRNMYLENDLPQQVISIYDCVDKLSPDILKSTQANYSGLVTMVDKWFGNLYECISDLKMLEDTVIMVTTDHGHLLGDHNDYMGKRGYPSSREVYDIPILLRHPNSDYGRNIRSNILIQHTDIVPTLLEIAGLEPKDSYYSYEWNTFFKRKSMMKPKKADLHGKSFFKTLLNKQDKFRDHVTIGAGPTITVIKNNWWLNGLVNGKGVMLYDLRNESAFNLNIADNYPEIVKELFEQALKDAGGVFPDILLDLANKSKLLPGCSDLAAY